MLTDYAHPPEQITGRRERRIPGVGSVVTLPGHQLPFRAINALGVKVGDYRTDEDAEAALVRQLPPSASRLAPVERCNVCRGRHASAECPVLPTVDATRSSYLQDKPAESRKRESATEVVDTEEPTVVAPVSEDPHSLDAYLEALRFAAPKAPCRIDAVRRYIWGCKGGRDATELALDKLVAQGRADRTLDGKYRARADPEARTRDLLEEGIAKMDLHHNCRCVSPEALVVPGGPIESTAADRWDDDGGAPLPSDDALDLQSPAAVEGAVPELEDEPNARPELVVNGYIDPDDEPSAGDSVEFTEPEVVPPATQEERTWDPGMGLHHQCRCIPLARHPRTIDDLADKYCPERVIEEAKDLAARLPLARERLTERLARELEVVTRDRTLLAEIDRYAAALGVEL